MEDDSMGFRKEQLDLAKVIKERISAENNYPEKNLVGSLIIRIIGEIKEMSESAQLTPEEKEVLCKYQETIVELRDQKQNSKREQLTSFSFGSDPVEESWEDVERMAEVIQRQEKLAAEMIEQSSEVLDSLVTVFSELMEEENPQDSKDVKSLLGEGSEEDVIDVQVD